MVEVYDARLKHPFTCVVAGPSGSRKSTFVRNLLLKQARLIDTTFDYVIIFLGTDTTENDTLATLGRVLPQRVYLVEVKNVYPTREELKSQFSLGLEEHVERAERQEAEGVPHL